jgi:hypothetical protein
MTGNGQSLCEKIGDVDGARNEENAERTGAALHDPTTNEIAYPAISTSLG